MFVSDKEEEEETKVSQEEESEEETMYIDREEYDRLVNENAQLKKQISKNNQLLLKRDMETRAELINMYTEMMNKKDEEFKYEKRFDFSNFKFFCYFKN